MLPASFVSPTANVLFPPTSEFRGENPHPSSPSWEQCDGDVPAMTAAAPIHGGGFAPDRGRVCAGPGSQGWDLQRRRRGLQGRGPFLPLLPSARGRILHCNFKCYNF